MPANTGWIKPTAGRIQMHEAMHGHQLQQQCKGRAFKASFTHRGSKEKSKEYKTLNLKQKRAKFRVKTPMPALSHIIYWLE